MTYTYFLTFGLLPPHLISHCASAPLLFIFFIHGYMSSLSVQMTRLLKPSTHRLPIVHPLLLSFFRLLFMLRGYLLVYGHSRVINVLPYRSLLMRVGNT